MKKTVLGQKKQRGFFADWFYTILWAGSIAILFRSFLLEPFNIPSGSMIPNLMVGDHLFVSKWSWGYSRFSFPFGSARLFDGRFLQFASPESGEIVIFRKPFGRVEYVKRLVGQPGDAVQMINGYLHINGQAAELSNPRRYVVANIPNRNKRTGVRHNDMTIIGNRIYVNGQPADFNYTIEYKTDRVCLRNPIECRILEGVEFTETLPNGRSYQIIKMQQHGALDNTELLIVPENHFFMIGDNRDYSMDSRHPSIGFVPRDNMLGPILFIFYSHNYYSPLLFVWDWMNKMRWDRFGYRPN